jgi:antitoxin component of RelBE/YafQ-DinJ toxin-antitoxin module
MKYEKPMTYRVTFRIDRELIDQIQAEAERNRMTVSDVVRWALAEGLADIALFDVNNRIAERLADIREFIVSRLQEKGGE